MYHTKSVLKPSLWEAILLIVLIVGMISVSIIKFEASPHMPILLSVLLLICYGLLKKVSYKQLESGLVEGAGAGMSAVFLFFLDRKSTRLNSSHVSISYAVFCLKKKKK